MKVMINGHRLNMNTYTINPDETWFLPSRQTSFYRRHEFVIWLYAVIIGLVFFLLFLENPNILWTITTPIERYV